MAAKTTKAAPKAKPAPKTKAETEQEKFLALVESTRAELGEVRLGEVKPEAVQNVIRALLNNDGMEHGSTIFQFFLAYDYHSERPYLTVRLSPEFKDNNAWRYQRSFLNQNLQAIVAGFKAAFPRVKEVAELRAQVRELEERLDKATTENFRRGPYSMFRDLPPWMGVWARR